MTPRQWHYQAGTRVPLGGVMSDNHSEIRQLQVASALRNKSPPWQWAKGSEA